MPIRLFYWKGKIMKWISLLVGGMLGTGARFVISGSVYHFMGPRFPYGTITVNLAGCFLIGFIAAIGGQKIDLGPHLRLFLVVGFCGAFTTFSTFILETANLIMDGHTLRAGLNVGLSVLLGFALLRLGVLLGEVI